MQATNKHATTQHTRRDFQTQLLAGATTAALTPTVLSAQEQPAVLGGQPLLKNRWPSWPVVESTEVDAVTDVIRRGDWSRYRSGQSTVDVFEKQWSAALKVPYCHATNCGTTSLVTSLAALGIGPGAKCCFHLTRLSPPSTAC